MHRLFGVATMAAALALSTPALGAPAAGGAKTRLGTLDMRKAFNDCRAGKDARDRLRADFERKQKKLDADQEEVKKLLAKGSSEADQAKRDAIGKQVEERTRALQDLYKRYQRELEEAEKAATAKLLKDIRSLVPPVAQVLKLASVAEADGIYFTDPNVERVDVTAEIVKRLDAITPKAKGPAGRFPTPIAPFKGAALKAPLAPAKAASKAPGK
jgi:Skp family chaperone for outer membrane proteins